MRTCKKGAGCHSYLVRYIKGGTLFLPLVAFLYCTTVTVPTSYPIHIDWDLGVALHYECQRKQIRKASYFNQWIDLRAAYKVSSWQSNTTVQPVWSGCL